MAAQSPTSPYHVGVLAGPVGQLRTGATVLALCTLAGAWLMPWIAAGQGRDPWLLVGAYHLGVALMIGSFVYGATTGMHGVQIDDPRPDSQLLFAVRALGYALLAGCLLDVARRVFTRRPPPDG
jgi:hypothetical protein